MTNSDTLVKSGDTKPVAMSPAPAGPRIVHEAEVQRQHPRFRFPSQCIIDGAAYEVFDWSLGGISFMDYAIPLAIGDLLDLRIVHTVASVAIVFEAIGEVRYQLPGSNRVGLRFTNVTDGQMTIMRRIFESYIIGEVLPYESMVGTLDTGSAQAANIISKGITPTRVIGLSTLGVLGLALTWTMSGNMYARSYIYRAASAMVEADSIPMGSPVAGRLNFLVDTGMVADGQVIASVRDKTGVDVTVDSPCDCRVGGARSMAGGYVRRGEALLRLIQPNAKVNLRVTLPRSALATLDSATISVTYPDGYHLIVPAINLKPKVVFEEDKANAIKEAELYADVRFDSGRDDLTIDLDQSAAKVVIDTSPIAPWALKIGFGG